MDEDTDLTDEQVEEETGIKQEDIDEEKVEVDLKKIDGKLVFETPEEAEEQAEKLGCKGSHTHKDEDGKTWYMPCESHDDYPQSMSLTKDVLDEDLSKQILGSLSETGVKMSEDYEYVDELSQDSDLSDRDWETHRLWVVIM